jgi:hypothetical protein
VTIGILEFERHSFFHRGLFVAAWAEYVGALSDDEFQSRLSTAIFEFEKPSTTSVMGLTGGRLARSPSASRLATFVGLSMRRCCIKANFLLKTTFELTPNRFGPVPCIGHCWGFERQ